MKGGSQAWKEFQFLEQAGDHFLGAAQAMDAGKLKLASLQQSLGQSRQAVAHAMDVGNNEAENHFQNSYRMLGCAFKAGQKKRCRCLMFIKK